jgi:hypothetical protein
VECLMQRGIAIYICSDKILPYLSHLFRTVPYSFGPINSYSVRPVPGATIHMVSDDFPAARPLSLCLR